MNRIKNLFKYIFVFALALFFVDNVYATSNISVGVRAVTPGKKICASSNVFGNAHLYGWDYNSDQPISVWPGEAMTKNDDNFYCYTVQNGKTFNMVLFNNDYDAQTINLSTIMDDSDLINDYLYIFNTPYDGKYIGVRNTEFHEHINIPENAPLGEYHLHFVVTDNRGQQTIAESHIELVEDDGDDDEDEHEHHHE